MDDKVIVTQIHRQKFQGNIPRQNIMFVRRLKEECNLNLGSVND